MSFINTNGFAPVVVDSATGALYNNKSKILTNSNVTYTFLATDTGKLIELGNASTITATLPNSFAVGWNCSVVQSATGTVTFSAAAGATLNNRQSQVSTAGRYAAVSLYVSTNSSGTNAVYILVGDTA